MDQNNFKIYRLLRCFKKMMACALIKENRKMCFCVILSLMFFVFSEYKQVENDIFMIDILKNKKTSLIWTFCLMKIQELALYFIAACLGDISNAYFLFTGLEDTLFDFLCLKWSHYCKHTTGELLFMQREKAEANATFIYELLINITSYTFSTIILIVNILKNVSTNIGIVLMFTFVTYFFIFLVFLSKFNNLQLKALHGMEKVRSITESESKNFNTIKTYNLNKISRERVSHSTEARRVGRMQYQTFDAKIKCVYKTFETLSIVLVFAFYYTNYLPDSSLNKIIFLSSKLYFSIRVLLDSINCVRSFFLTYYIFEEMYARPKVKNGMITDFSVLNCEDVAFSGVFSSVSIDILNGQKIAIVGRNGSGKSLFLRTLTGMIETRGKITFNSKNITEINSKSLHDMITYISQSDCYTQGSVMKNLKYGNNLSSQEIVEMCKEFKVDNVFNDLSDGYEKHSESLGVSLSGGQKQRVSFMRGILRKTPLLLVDACLSDLNCKDRNFLFNKLLTINDRTIIAVCNSLEDSKKFDQIVLLGKKNSKIGNFNDLENDLIDYFK